MAGPEDELAAAAAGRGHLRKWKCYPGRHDYVEIDGLVRAAARLRRRKRACAGARGSQSKAIFERLRTGNTCLRWSRSRRHRAG